jgi:hypothetical protein
MKARVSLDPREALYECVLIDRTTAQAGTVATCAELGLVAAPQLASALGELEQAHRQARQLGLVVGASPLRPWLARLLRTQRATRKRLRAAIAARGRVPPR